MSQFEQGSPAFSTSRRLLAGGRVPRIGVNESLSAPGVVASPLTESRGSALAGQLMQALTGTASLVADIGNDARRQRIAEEMQQREIEQQQRQMIRDAATARREVQAADRLVAAEDRSAASVAAQLYAEQFDQDIKTGRVDIHADPSETIRSRIEEATQGQSEHYTAAFAKAFSVSGFKAINNGRDEMRANAYAETMKRSPSMLLATGDPAAAKTVVDDMHALNPSVPYTTVLSQSVVPAAKAAATANRPEQVDMLLSLLPDEQFGVDKAAIRTDLAQSQLKEKSAVETAGKNKVLGMLADTNTSIQAARDELSKLTLPGDDLLTLRNAIDGEETKRMRAIEDQRKAATKEYVTATATANATALWRTGQAWMIQPVDAMGVTMTVDEQKAAAAKARAAQLQQQYPDNPQAVFRTYVSEAAQNDFEDPMLKAYLGGLGPMVSTALIDQNSTKVDDEITARVKQYREVALVSPVYAKKLAGDSAMMYEAIDDVLATQPAGDIAGAARAVADNSRKNIIVRIDPTDARKIQAKAEAWVRPLWLVSSASNETEITTKMERLVRGYMRLGSSFDAALKRSKTRIDETHKIINGWAVEVTDSTLPQDLTAVLYDRLDKYKAKYPEDAAYVGNGDDWTMDFNARTGTFSIVNKNAIDRLPTMDPELTIVTSKTMKVEGERLAKESLKRKPAAGNQPLVTYRRPMR